MSRLADRRDFGDAVGAAADALRIPTPIVEKDYWVTQALRAMGASHSGEWIFKGGTSLSKGYGLIRRFSEDIDVLILPRSRGAGARDRVMKEIATSAALAVGLDELPPSGPADRGVHRTYALPYPQVAGASGALRPSVLLEMGIRGGPTPNEPRKITALVAAAGVLDPAEYDDLAPFEVSILHPGRTLVEKLLLVTDAATRVRTGELDQVPAGCGRHLYDIHELLGSEYVLAFLDDRERFLGACDEAFEIGSEHFGTRTGRPEKGFATSPAFDGGGEDQAARAMSDALASVRELAFPGSPWPSYDGLVARIQKVAGRL